MTKTSLDQLTYDIIGAAIQVHNQLGPGYWKASIMNA